MSYSEAEGLVAGLAEWGRGIKAGIVPGLLYMLVATSLSIAFLPANLPQLQIYLNIPQLAEWAGWVPGWAVPYGLAIFTSAIVGILGGAFIGLVFAGLYSLLPGENPPSKGLIFTFFFWVVFGLVLGVENPSTLLLAQLAVALFFGGLLGAFWGKAGSSKHRKVK